MILSGNGVVAQSGGPTAVINNSVCGVVGMVENSFRHCMGL